VIKRDDEELTPIQIDIYGVKLKAQPQPDAEPHPESWKDVGRRVNRELMATVAGIVRLLSTTVAAVTSVVRGLGDLGRLPGAIEKRIENAHERADEGETKRAVQQTPESRAAAEDTIRRILRKKVTEGLAVGTKTDGERLIFLVLTPMEDEKLDAVANYAMGRARQIDGLVELPVDDSGPTLRRSSRSDDAEIANSIEEIDGKLRRDGG
jgi:hypothetical protein